MTTPTTQPQNGGKPTIPPVAEHFGNTAQSKNYRDIPRDMIIIDPEFNMRGDYGSLPEFAEQLKREGLLHPPSAFPILEGKHKGKFFLFAGFRRMGAIDILGWKTVPIHVEEIAEEEAAVRQQGENLNRKNLTTFEQAQGFKRQIEKYKWTADRLSTHLSTLTVEGITGTSKAHIGNMVRAVDKLAKPMLEQWKLGHPKMSLHNVIKLASMDHDEQKSYWQTLIEDAPPDAKQCQKMDSCVLEDGHDGACEASDDVNPKPKKDKGRASEMNLAQALIAVKSCGEKEAWKEGAIASLRFALGQVGTIPGVYEPKKAAAEAKKAKEKEREEAKKEKEKEKKEAAKAKEAEKVAAQKVKEAEKKAKEAKAKSEKEAEKLAKYEAAEKAKAEAKKAEAEAEKVRKEAERVKEANAKK